MTSLVYDWGAFLAPGGNFTWPLSTMLGRSSRTVLMLQCSVLNAQWTNWRERGGRVT